MNLQAFYDSTALTNKGVLLDAEKAYSSGNDSLTETILNTITPSDQIEYNYKLFYSLSLKYFDSTFSSIDSLDLYNLAIACPDKDGNIVYQARSLYNSIYTTAETFESNCNESSAKSLTNFTDVFSEKEIGITIYPNPNNGEFLVNVTDEDESLTSLTAILRDVSGKLLYKSTMEIIDNKLKMNYLAKPGMYYLELINPMTNKSFTEKIMILK
ncbi:MAG: T9SS type A sorting domain-containing protein [Crocinitomicaceae bacterium]|nr:T9SS type A sorting domain-containing protein [Crocinitomicaceae bacterium]